MKYLVLVVTTSSLKIAGAIFVTVYAYTYMLFANLVISRLLSSSCTKNLIT